MIDSDTASKGVAIGLAALTIFGEWLGKWWEKSHPSQKADEIAKASVDISKVLLDHDKAHLDELDNLRAEHKVEVDQYEARELNLTAEKSELMRQNAIALHQLTADRDADRLELRHLRDQMGALREDVEEGKRLHENCELRMIQLQASFDQQERTHRDIVNAMTNQLDTKDRRGYRAAKLAEKASAEHGPFTATDVWPEGKPKP